jgi:ubiquinone/menaquinone biosynthesis C-methylase UbiE
MPTVDWNRDVWDKRYDWADRGDVWSSAWGGADMQWYGSILPRIHSFVPAKRILEIAPGYGRWTQFLKDICEELEVVDLSANCIAACRERFKESSNIKYHVNDGTSLEMVKDGSVDLVFSFDSLVHAEGEIIKKYIEQLSAKLTPDGIGVIHHSNLGEYKGYFSFCRKMMGAVKKIRNMAVSRKGSEPGPVRPPKFVSGGFSLLTRSGILDSGHSRSISMTAAKFEEYVKGAGMCCISQELINWGTVRLIDCITVFTRKGSRRERENVVLRNPYFMKEAARIRKSSRSYSEASFVV